MLSSCFCWGVWILGACSAGCEHPPAAGGCVGEIRGTNLAGSVEKSSPWKQKRSRCVGGLSKSQPVLCPHTSPHLISSSCHSKACAGACRSARSWATRGERGQRRWGWAYGLYHLQEGPLSLLAPHFFSKPSVLKEKMLLLLSYISTEFCFFAPIGDE